MTDTPEIAECSECGEAIQRHDGCSLWDHVMPRFTDSGLDGWYKTARQRTCWMKATPKDGKPSPESLLDQALELLATVPAALIVDVSGDRITINMSFDAWKEIESFVHVAKIGAKS